MDNHSGLENLAGKPDCLAEIADLRARVAALEALFPPRSAPRVGAYVGTPLKPLLARNPKCDLHTLSEKMRREVIRQCAAGGRGDYRCTDKGHACFRCQDRAAAALGIEWTPLLSFPPAPAEIARLRASADGRV